MNEYTGADEADVEDLLGRDGYVALVTKAYALRSFNLASPGSGRVVKDVEDAFRVMDPATPEFDHFFPSSYIIEHPAVIKALPGHAEALDRFEALFKDLNKLLV